MFHQIIWSGRDLRDKAVETQVEQVSSRRNAGDVVLVIHMVRISDYGKFFLLLLFLLGQGILTVGQSSLKQTSTYIIYANTVPTSLRTRYVFIIKMGLREIINM